MTTSEELPACCMTVTEAARRVGLSRQALDDAIHRGVLPARTSGRTRLIRQADLAQWAASRRPRNRNPSKAAGLSFRQVELLLALDRGESLSDYAWFITTIRALERRGLVESHYGQNRLTPAGEAAVVAELAARGVRLRALRLANAERAAPEQTAAAGGAS